MTDFIAGMGRTVGDEGVIEGTYSILLPRSLRLALRDSVRDTIGGR